MGDENEQKVYKLINLATNEELPRSKRFTGAGEAHYSNGDVYNGEFENGRRHGQGKYTYANGDEYEGQFEMNQKQGAGRMTYKDKGFYHGYFKAGKRNGEGLFMHPNQDRYSGLWKNGQKHGEGTYIIHAAGVKLTGKWFENRILKGKWVMANGNYYEGEFEHNKPRGNGVWKLANGNVINGEYVQEILEKTEEEDPMCAFDETTGLRIRLGWRTEQISKA